MIPRGPAVAAAGDSGAKAAPQTRAGANQILHTVAAGENLRRIGQQYGVTPQEIQRWNGLDDDSIIKLGQRLSIWSTAKTAGPELAKTTTTTTTTTIRTTTKKVGYTVQNGDSLTAIASRFNVQIDDILKWNTVNSRALLQPGQKLTLYTRQ
jgi:membrane-bound lytic murein transglycosylase D